MGQDLARLGNECDCWVSGEESHQGVQVQPAMVDPVANLVSKDVPRSTVVPKKAEESPPAGGTIAPPFYNIAAWAQDSEADSFVIPPPPEPLPALPVPEVSPTKAEPSPAASPPRPAAPPAPAAPAPAPAPAASTASAAPRKKEPVKSAPVKRQQDSPGVSIDAVLTDLEGAEQAAFKAAFKSLSSGLEVLPLDHDQLRSFILINSGVTEQDLEVEMLKLASARDDFSIDASALISLLREHPIGDDDVLNLFMSLSTDGESLSSEECRTGLLQVTSRLPETGLSEERMDRVFDRVLTSAGLTVSMEEWLQYAKTTARILRLIAYSRA